MESSPLRKSSRKRQQSQRYSSNGYVDLSQINDDSDNASPPLEQVDADDSADAFDPDGDVDMADEGIEAEGDSPSSAAFAVHSDFAGDEGDGDQALEDDDDVVALTPEAQASAKPSKGPYVQKVSMKQPSMKGDHSYTRGLLDPKTKGAKDAVKLFLFGPAQADQEAALRGAYRWRSQPLLPRRKADKSGSGGFVRSFYQKDADRQREMDEDWQWYDSAGGRAAFAEQAVVTDMDAQSAEAYMPSAVPSLEIVLGPAGNQKIYELPSKSSMQLGVPFASPDGTRSVTKRAGWLINAGERVQALVWTPNQQGSSQYLLVATSSRVSPALTHVGGHRNVFSHFQPQGRIKTSLQIWQFETDGDGRVDASFEPRLRQVMCTDWGDVRSLKWCHMPRKYDDTPGSTKHLGLLAGIWGDGALRVLDIHLSDSTSTHYSRFVRAAITARIPNTVLSSFVWLSPHGLAVGTATGSVAIYNIPAQLRESTDAMAPILLSRIHDSYIVNMTTCYPSRPHMLITSSMSGMIMLTDLHRVSPTTGFNPANTVTSARNRIGRGNIAWHDWSQVLLSVDELNTLTGMALRRFHAVVGLSRFHSAIRCLATSELHPFVAAAGYGGEVTFLNPMRRILKPKEEMHNLRWFVHTWRRKHVPDTSIPGLTKEGYEAPSEDGDIIQSRSKAGPDSSILLGRDGGGLIRMIEGFKPETVSLSKASGDKQTRGPIVPTTVYEAQTAVTSLVWNNNIKVGGWIAAGMATGLVRVEDVGTD